MTSPWDFTDYSRVTFEEEGLPDLLFKFYLQGPGVWKTKMSQEVMVVINGGVRLFLAFRLNRKKNFATKYLLVVIEQRLDMGFQMLFFQHSYAPHSSGNLK